ncbi:hypothetical protein [Rhodohalobacter sulfatireducens]|uniref:Uncharacterized protein n=1 Tax=Rhodohalobacter sulfatireducens TaxID=2911366 RepID=A0ABS9KDM7_9BACT|nr:hypothetical protein [Rhodohalobacter sulfatireducens]MCG2588954.1 hypothetical protein [Rhodohalobacter sulfatireducens]
MVKRIYKTVLVLFLLGTTSCSDALNSTTDTTAELEFMEPMTSALMSLESNEASGNGIFILNWSALNPRFLKDNENKLGLAMAIGFDEQVSFKPPYHTSTVDMGSVRIESAQGESVGLSKQSSRFSGEHTVYSHRSFGPFSNESSLSYQADAEYTISTTGSETFPALNLKATTPEKQVSIVTPSSNRMENHSGGVELSWDAVSGKPVAIHIRPSFNPKEGEKPGKFNREDSEMILLEDQNGTYTISGETLSEIADRTGAHTLHISVGQLHVNDVESGGQTYRVIMRSSDHLRVDLD